MAKTKTVSQTLREALEKSGRSMYEVAGSSGVTQSSLSRFLSSGRGLSLENLDTLCAHLGLELREVRKTKKGA